MSFFAERLKELRLKQGFTMQSLSERAQVSKSMICKIERDEVQPTIDVAARLAHALGKTLSEMLHATQSTPMIYIPKEEQPTWQDAEKIQRRNISPVMEDAVVEWLHVTFPKGASLSKRESHHFKYDEKYMLVTAGALEITANNQKFLLNAGDSFYFRGNLEHEMTNVYNGITEYYVVLTKKNS